MYDIDPDPKRWDDAVSERTGDVHAIESEKERHDGKRPHMSSRVLHISD